jgi:hypothetical protein
MARRDSRNWPPTDIVRDLLTQTRRVTTGEVPLTGPDGVRVVHTSTGPTHTRTHQATSNRAHRQPPTDGSTETNAGDQPPTESGVRGAA